MISMSGASFRMWSWSRSRFRSFLFVGGMGGSEEEEVGIRYVWRVYSRFFIFAFCLFAFCYFGVKYMNIHKDNTYLYR